MRTLALLAATVAPLLLSASAFAQDAAAPKEPGKAANICRELTSYLSGAQQSTGAPAPQAATAVAAPPQKADAPQPSSAGGTPQQSAGLSGPVPASGPGAAGPQGAAQATSQAAPKPAAAASPAPAAPTAPSPTPEMIQRTETAAKSNDIAGCRDAARAMRLAGVALPSPLLALAALNLKLLQRAD